MGNEDLYSTHTGQIRTFGIVDYVLFSLVLVVSTLIGIYYAYKDRNKATTDTFLLAGKSMSIFPVAISLTVTFLSALSLLGNPVEVYNYHTMLWWLIIGMLIAVAGSAHVFTPFFYRLKITTVFEYLQMRFNTTVRVFGSVLVILQTLVYFSFVLYAPSLALSSVTQVSLWGTVVGVGLVVTFYTTLGGMKAVVWTDTFQAVVILAGLLAVLIQGSIVTGGFGNAWQVADERGRIKFDDFSADPSTRHSVWSVVIGGGSFWLSLYGVNQAQVQRCLTCPSVRKAQIALWINCSGIITICSLCFMIGVVMFAFYADCHPEGIISRRDQLLPLFVMDILADYQGVPGVFVACVFSGSLSSLSSGLNAISAVAIKDLFLPYCCPRLSDFKTTLLNKLMVIVSGALGIALAYMVGNLSGAVLQVSLSIYSILNGPMFGIFLLGIFFPWANSIGAVAGCITSLGFMSWIVIGAFVHKVTTAARSPVVTSGCVWRNITTVVTTTATAAAVATNTSTPTATSASGFINSLSSYNISPTATVNPDVGTAAADPTEDIPAYPIYTLSYLYYTVTGAFVVVVVGLIVSFITGHTKSSSLDPRLICPLFDILFPCLPECILRPLRLGIDHEGKYEKHEKKKAEMEAAFANDITVSIDEATSTSPPSKIDQTASSVPVLHTISGCGKSEKDHDGFTTMELDDVENTRL